LECGSLLPLLLVPLVAGLLRQKSGSTPAALQKAKSDMVIGQRRKNRDSLLARHGDARLGLDQSP
jgi:hypothetical protein